MSAFTLADAVDRLYGAPPAAFVAERKRLVARAREAGDRALADEINALRKPTAVAHAINHLARSGRLQPLAELGDRFRRAQAELDTASMKSLAAERSSLLAGLTDEAARSQSLSAAARDQLVQTFTASIASAAAERAVLSGSLVTALSYSGFGEVTISADAVASGYVGAGSVTAGSVAAGAASDDPEAEQARAGGVGSEIRRVEAQVAAARAELDRAQAALAAATARAEVAHGALDKAHRTVEAARRTCEETDGIRDAAQIAADSAAANMVAAQSALERLIDQE